MSVCRTPSCMEKLIRGMLGCEDSDEVWAQALHNWTEAATAAAPAPKAKLQPKAKLRAKKKR